MARSTTRIYYPLNPEDAPSKGEAERDLADDRCEQADRRRLRPKDRDGFTIADKEER